MYDWSGKTILIVEDDISSTFFLKEVLSCTRAKLKIVDNGQSAIFECDNNGEIDLILMDIQLPVLNGYKTTIEIKKSSPSIPIIAQTAYALIDERQRCFDAGCDDYIAKPIEPLNLLEIMNKYLVS
jgi:CheY-like chemotaxis protein